MVRRTTRVPLLFILLLSLLGLAAVAQEGGNFKTYRSTTQGFSVEYPVDWYFNPLVRSFAIDSYPLRKAVRGVGTPPGGAGITLVSSEALAYDKRPQTINGWAETEAAHANATGTREFELQDRGRNLQILEVRSRFGAKPPFGEGIWWYFEVGDHMFHASLGYWEGDPNQKKYLDVLKQIVLSLKLNQ